jgi:hypothetical protein
MEHFFVLYREPRTSLVLIDEPQAFSCEADDPEHAEEQCLNAYPGCELLWVYGGPKIIDPDGRINAGAALEDYYGRVDGCHP